MKENQLARDIVANLARRYRRAKARARSKDPVPADFQELYDVEELAAWGAYAASKRVLHGLDD